MKRERPTIVAIYCPLWHRYDHMDSWKGDGWSEWELLKTALCHGENLRTGQ